MPCFLPISAQSNTAVSCGTPEPVITLVMHMEPEPTPTLTASTPALIRSSVPCAVATFPAISSLFGNAFLIRRTVFSALSLCPCAISTTITSAPASKSASALSIKSPFTPIAAPTSGLPFLSFDAAG